MNVRERGTDVRYAEYLMKWLLSRLRDESCIKKADIVDAPNKLPSLSDKININN